VSTLVVYADTSDEAMGSDDGYGQDFDTAWNGTYSAARSGTGYSRYPIYSGVEAVGQEYAVGNVFYDGDDHYYDWFAVYESFLAFDTSSIPDGDTVSAAVLRVTSYADYSTTNFDIQARLHDWGTTADWVAGADLSGLTLLGSYATSGGFTATTGYDFSDTAMAANVNKTGSTRMLFCSSRTVGNNAPTTTEYVNIYSADESGTTRDPKLTVTYAAGSTEVYDGPGPTLDAWIIATRTGSFTAAAILKRTQVGSFTADAAIKSTVAGSFTTNAVLLRGQTGSFAANAITLKAASSSFTAAATIKATVADSTKADAIRLRTFWFGRVEDGF